MMSSEMAHLNTRSCSYDPPREKKLDDVPHKKPLASTPPPNNGIHTEKPIPEAIFHPPKGTLRKSIINPNPSATQYYNIVKYFSQEPYIMSALEVLQTFPTQ